MRLVLVILVVLSACDAGEKPRPPETVKPIAKAPQPKPSSATFALDYLPADVDIVMHLDVAKLRRSKLWASYANDVAKVVMRGFAHCSDEPMKEITSITIGIPLETELDVFVVRGIDRDKTLACLRDLKTKFKFDGELVSYPVKSGMHLLKFVDATTAVIQGPKQPTKDTLTKALQAGAPLAENSDLVAAIESARKSGVDDAAFTLVSRPGSTVLARKTADTGTLKQMAATVRLTDRIDVRYSMTFGTTADAAQMAKTMKEQLDNASIKQMFDRLDTKMQGETITIDMGMTEPQLSSFAGIFRGMLGSE
jgi:hypothetical protein